MLKILLLKSVLEIFSEIIITQNLLLRTPKGIVCGKVAMHCIHHYNTDEFQMENKI